MNKNIKYHWVSLFGKPEKISEISYIDEYGSWDSSFYRADGSIMGFKPSPLELFRTKKELLRSLDYFSKVRKAVSKVKY